MSKTKKLTDQNRLTDITDDDSLVCLSSGNETATISFADLNDYIKDLIQVGGRNYIPNSNFAKGAEGIDVTGGFKSLMVDDFESSPVRFGRYALRLSRSSADTYTSIFNLGSLEAGRKYTFTLWGRNAGSIIGSSSFIYVDDSQMIPIDTRFDISNAYSRKSVTFTLPMNPAIGTTRLHYRKVGVRIGFKSQDNAWMLIEAMKLEQGSIGTDWTPAPEDLNWGG